MASTAQAFPKRLDWSLSSKLKPVTYAMDLPFSYYRKVGANKSRQVTKTSSMGMWLPVHNEEWDGDVPLGYERAPGVHSDAHKGTVTFKGNTLPWIVGQYEVSTPMTH